jgi:hypothetical protein
MAKMFSCFLLALLLLWTSPDDLFAGLTEDPSDDAVAAENNEYLAPQDDQDTRLPGHGTPPAHAPTLFSDPLPTQAPCQGGLSEAHALVLPGPDPVYLLMSLQR